MEINNYFKASRWHDGVFFFNDRDETSVASALEAARAHHSRTPADKRPAEIAVFRRANLPTRYRNEGLQTVMHDYGDN